MNRTKVLPVDFSSRRKRRSALAACVFLLEQILHGEVACRNNTPANLLASEAYEMTENYIWLLEDAIDTVRSIYDD